MKFEHFKNIADQYKLLDKELTELEEIGFNLFDSKYKIADRFSIIMEEVFLSHYTVEGLDWINWFFYENDFGRSGLTAYDDKKLICQTIEDLHKYIEQNHKLKE